MEFRSDIHERVLHQLLDGVMVVARDGTITVFNAAAGHILGIPPSEAVGGSFGELFIQRDEFEELSELVLGAVADGNREHGREVVKLPLGDRVRSLSVATSYLRSDTDAVPVALIAVFSDITEIRELRETELRMAETLQTKHNELQTAYRQIEERNDTLATILKRVQVARVVATIAVVGVLLGVGTYAWRPLDLFGVSAPSLTSSADAETVTEPDTMVVEAKPIRETMSLVGRLAPWRTVTVTSPIASRVTAMHVKRGQEVEKGDLLVELDTAETVRQLRQAKVAYIEARDAFEAVKGWKNGPEIADARRSYTRARIALNSQESRLKRTGFLLKQGLIAASEHEDAERQHRSQLLDFEAARADFQATMARGGKDALEKAALELSSAREVMRELEQTVTRSQVRSPLAGVVMAPSRPGFSVFAEGRSVDKGEALLEIGDYSRMAALARVDEVDVVRIAVGQPVSITGNAYRDLRLQGNVTRVSSQPLPQTRAVTQFQIEVTLDALKPAYRERLRTGMSSRLEIVVYHNESALLVPIGAVRRSGGIHRLRVVDPSTREVQDREVRIGPTTLESVEIVAGLRAGEEIVVSTN